MEFYVRIKSVTPCAQRMLFLQQHITIVDKIYMGTTWEKWLLNP